MKLPFQINWKNKYVLIVLAFLLSGNVVFSSELNVKPPNSMPYAESVPANIKKTERENTFVYSFHPMSSPEKDLFNKSLDRFRQIEGFISLSVNSQNEVELVTTKNIEKKENTHLLMVSARLYGYIGYQIVE
jgi:hypothetical protein